MGSLLAERLAHPRRGGTPEFKMERLVRLVFILVHRQKLALEMTV